MCISTSTQMLAFDIETKGLDPLVHDVTCVCAEDFHTGKRYAFEYARVRKEDPEKLAGLTTELVKLFDDASSLCAFNGIRFDLPFMEHALKIPKETVTKWKSKTSDILEKCREEYKHTFKLDLLCECNQVLTKSSSGLQAITWANEERWKDLQEYCEMDVHILCELYRKRVLVNPRNKAKMDLIKWTHKDVYGGDEMQVDSAAKEEVAAETNPPAPSASAGTEQYLMAKIAQRQRRLPIVNVPEYEVFGVANKFAVCKCPLCDMEGFIQEDTQCLGVNLQFADAIFSCGMKHAYCIKVD